MSGNTLEALQSLVKALEAGSYNAAPGTLVQGAALQVEDLSPVMHNVTFEEKHLKLQKEMKVESCKSTLAQFDRQLSYGNFGGSAQFEGAVGQEETSDFVRIVVPMCYYSHTRRVTVVANMVGTVDGVKAEERAARDAALKIAADIEFDLFRGKADFINSGVFDGAPGAVAESPAMVGLDLQIRQSDSMRQAQDAMFAEYGSSESVVLPVGTYLTQPMVEDASVRSAMNLGEADRLLVDPRVLSQYNKIVYDKERIMLAGSPQDATGADLRRQWVSGGTVQVESSRFLSGKTSPQRPRQHSNAPAAPTIALAAVGSTTSLAAGTYRVYVTGCNEIGESVKSATSTQAIVLTDELRITITPVGSLAKWFNVYCSPAGGATDATCKFIGRIAANGTAAVVFNHLGNKLPGFVTGFLIQKDTMGMKELAPYSRLKLAVTNLSLPEAHFRFCTLAVFQPRKNCILDNLLG